MTRLSLLVDLSSLLAREVDLDALLATACDRLADALRADRATIWLVDAEQGDLVTRVATLPEVAALRQPRDKGIAGYVARTGHTVRVDDAANDDRFDPTADRLTGYTTRSLLVAPIREDEQAPARGVIQLLNRHDGVFDEEDERYLGALATQLARALALTTLRGKDSEKPGFVLRGPFNRIVGRGPQMDMVYQRIGRAAQTDATVLLRGETGTGKGLFARAIHVNSTRQSKPFVTVDCTTLPAQLVESELFGHERGAFTGADRRVPGRVELAEGGTLFIDEIGDLPLELQGKLLRFLQDRTFERVGGREARRADVRVVCATHQRLEEAVDEGRFREDLYYRIRVVEVELPSLRERGPHAIAELAQHFAGVYAERYGRSREVEPHIAPDAMEMMVAHDWPGNVRELEHWVESAMALSVDGNIRREDLPQRRRTRGDQGAVPLGSSIEAPPSTQCDEMTISMPVDLTLREATRRYIEAAVRACDGNRTEAARRLDVGRNTVGRTLGARRGKD